MGIHFFPNSSGLRDELLTPGIYLDNPALSFQEWGSHAINLPKPHRPSGEKPKQSYIEVLCQAKDFEELDTRVRINLQESLIRFIKDEKKWASLPLGEQNRLLQKLTTRTQNNLFGELITVKGQDERGNVVTRQVNLLLDTTRNKNLSDIFDQIVNQQIALVFHQELCYGLVDHLDRLVDLESQIIAVDENHADSHMLPISYVDLQDNFLPLSARDLALIRESGLGIMVQLIPRFMRLPLNKVYYAITQKNKLFPSLALQFYLDSYFASRPKLPGYEERQELLRTFFTKSFYAIVRLGGLTMEHLNLPEANRDSRFDYLTNDDEDSTLLMSQNGRSEERQGFISLREELQRLRDRERQIRQRRQVHGPAVKTELNLERVLEDIFHVYRDEARTHTQTEVDHLTQTAWLPQKKIEPLTTWEEETLRDHCAEIFDENALSYLSQAEQNLIYAWQQMVEHEYNNDKTFSQLEAIGLTDAETFKQALYLRLADRHREIVEQNKEIIVQQIIKQITRMLKAGGITPDMIVRDRYDSFSQDVLPYIYYFTTPNAKGETIWIESPYPLSKLIHLIQQVETMTDHKGSPFADGINLSLAKQLLIELLLYEKNRLDQSTNPLANSPVTPSSGEAVATVS